MTRCWGFHEWENWQTFESGVLLKHTDDIGLPIHPPEEPRVVGRYEAQRRKCSKCGKSQLREIQA